MVYRNVVRILLALLFASLLLSCGGGGGDGGSLIPPDSSTFPLHVEAGKRYLVDAQNRPFLIHGDSAWSLIAQLTREEVDVYLEDRRQKGFNTILVSLIEHYYATNPPFNRYGQQPFPATPFLAPNDSYFAHADYVISKAAEKGILVLLTPAYAGIGTEGWWQQMQARTTTDLRNYGRYVGNRYKGFSNILWVHGGDLDVPDKDVVRAIVDGIRDFDTRSLNTYHGGRGSTALGFFGTGESWLSVNNIYTDSTNVVSLAFQEYQRSDMPFFLIEANYETPGSTGQDVRSQAYQAVLSGAAGQLMGNWPVWHFNSPTAASPGDPTWQVALDSPGARSMQQMRRFLGGIAWWTLVPNQGFFSNGASTGKDQAVAALAANGSSGVVYIPSFRTSITVDLTQLAGSSIIARWCDPVDGDCSRVPVPGSPLTRNSSTVLTMPPDNIAGETDWLLVLEATP